MHWLIAELYLFLWIAAAVVFVGGLVRMFTRTIIGKGEFSQLLLYVVTIATLAAFLTPQFDEAIRYCAKLLLVAEFIALFLAYRRRRRQ